MAVVKITDVVEKMKLKNLTPGIDLTDKAFWKAGLEQIAKKVEAFVEL